MTPNTAMAKKAKDTYVVPCQCCATCNRGKPIRFSAMTVRCKLVGATKFAFGVCYCWEKHKDQL